MEQVYNFVNLSPYLITGNIESGKREGKVAGGLKGDSTNSHSAHILCIAISTDGKFLVSFSVESAHWNCLTFIV